MSCTSFFITQSNVYELFDKKEEEQHLNSYSDSLQEKHTCLGGCHGALATVHV